MKPNRISTTKPWDGRNDNGELVADTKGKYTFEVKATMKGEEIPKSGVVRLKYAKVNGVTPGSGCTAAGWA